MSEREEGGCAESLVLVVVGFACLGLAFVVINTVSVLHDEAHSQAILGCDRCAEHKRP